MLNSVRNVLSGLCSWRARWKTRNVSVLLGRGKKKRKYSSLNLNRIAVTFRNREEEGEFKCYRVYDPLIERHPHFRSSRTAESKERRRACETVHHSWKLRGRNRVRAAPRSRECTFAKKTWLERNDDVRGAGLITAAISARLTQLAPGWQAADRLVNSGNE